MSTDDGDHETDTETADRRPECHYRSCDRLADCELRYSEPGTPVTYKSACDEHATTERIHDPINVTRSESYDGPINHEPPQR